MDYFYKDKMNVEKEITQLKLDVAILAGTVKDILDILKDFPKKPTIDKST